MARISPRWLLRGGVAELGLSKSEALVLLCMLDHANGEGIAWPSERTVARELGIARSTVQLALDSLVAKGALQEHEPASQGRSARYKSGHQLAR